MLGFGLWQQRFGGDRSVIGRSINLDEQAYTVVGVLPADFQLRLFDYEAKDIWAPKIFRPNELSSPSARLQNYRNVVARLKPTVSIEQARAEMDTIAANLARQYPTSNANTGVAIVPLHEQLFGHLKPALLVLLGAVGFVLLIACANVANLLLARGVKRERELSIRAALGASRSRLVRQLLTESMLLGGIGCAAGLTLAYAGTRLIVGLAPGDVPHLDAVTIDLRVVSFAIAVAALRVDPVWPRAGVAVVAAAAAPVARRRRANGDDGRCQARRWRNARRCRDRVVARAARWREPARAELRRARKRRSGFPQGKPPRSSGVCLRSQGPPRNIAWHFSRRRSGASAICPA